MKLMNRILNYPKTPWILLALIIAGAVLGNILWIHLDQSPPLWDMAGHSARALLMRDYLAGGHLLSILRHDTIYPPFVTTLTGVLFWIFGRQADIPQLSFVLYVGGALWATYGIAKRLFRSATAGVLGALIVASAPLAAHFSRTYDLDYPLMALTAVSFWCLLKTEKFTNRRWSIALGFIVAAGLLTKWTLFVFFLGPLALSILQDTSNRALRWKNFFIAAVIVGVIAAPWYALHGKAILKTAVATRNNGFSVPAEQLFGVESSTFYWHHIVSGMSWPIAILGLVGLGWLVIRKHESRWLMLSWTLVPYLVMTYAFYSKESRYVLPLYPAIALSAGFLVTQIGNGWIRRGLILLTIVWCIAMWMQSSWGGFISTNFATNLGVEKTYGFSGASGFGYTWPTAYGTAIKNIAPVIQADLKHRGPQKYLDVAVVPNSIFLNDDSMRYYGQLAGLPIRTALSNQLRGKDWRTAMLKADYLVTKTGDQGPKVFQGLVGQIVDEEKNPDSQIFAHFELLGRWPVHDPEFGYPEIRLYRKK